MDVHVDVRRRVRVTGTVQGVGFRPFVHRRAVALGLAGWVLNDSGGVLLEAQGPREHIDALCRSLVEDAPPLATVSSVHRDEVPVEADASGFVILASSHAGDGSVPVSIDTATCPACRAEIDDPFNRRFGYPFTNCTNCGPRYTIVKAVPYDRATTTMAAFTMCPACAAEYHDPADRRFHAEPNACPTCGPRLSWIVPRGSHRAVGAAAFDAAIAAIEAGHVVAMKGIGGYHLVVDATNEDAVETLRRRKVRGDKPFALMVADVDAARDLCDVDTDGCAALTSVRAPIVLVPRRADAAVADGVAPGLAELGLMLPYSPLHHLLLARLRRPLVMTSGNLSDEPIAHEDDEAIERLAPLVDGLLIHDRPIHVRCDDSVVRQSAGHGASGVQVLRRSRGYAPERLPLPFTTAAQVLAVGAELKNTVAAAMRDWIAPSHHIGDLEHLATYRSFLRGVEHLPRLFGVHPDVVAHDLHPEYLSTKFALQLDIGSIAVQHHHAHIAACMVEHGRITPVLGLAFDGLGYGPDGTLWGGEIMVADLHGFRRVGHLRAVRMPGGAAAIREPWRMSLAWASAAAGRDAALEMANRWGVDAQRARTMLAIAELDQSPVTTSMGRLFDAAAALIGVRQRVTYEAQAAIELEAVARRAANPRRYEPVAIERGDDVVCLDPIALLRAVIDDVRAGADSGDVAAGFHDALARGVVSAATELASVHGLETVAVSGGVFQNALFADGVVAGLRGCGLEVLTHQVVPPNDGGISVGQAAIAAYASAD